MSNSMRNAYSHGQIHLSVFASVMEKKTLSRLRAHPDQLPAL